jgi:hypothetical protein
MPSERTSDVEIEKAQRADVIREQLDEVDGFDAFLFIGVEGVEGKDGYRLTGLSSIAHGDPDVLKDCLEEVLADLRGGIGRPH